MSAVIERGTLVGIIGHTGSGKGTLIEHFIALLKGTSGVVLLDGVDVWADKRKVRSVRFRVGVCFQYPEYQLFEETVYKDIAFGPKNMGLSDSEIDRRVKLSEAEAAKERERVLSYSNGPVNLDSEEFRRAHGFQLNPGDAIFIFTHGVKEVVNEKDMMFGEERILEALNREPEASPSVLLQTVQFAVETFAGEVPQVDDMTMLALKYYGKGNPSDEWR